MTAALTRLLIRSSVSDTLPGSDDPAAGKAPVLITDALTGGNWSMLRRR